MVHPFLCRGLHRISRFVGKDGKRKDATKQDV